MAQLSRWLRKEDASPSQKLRIGCIYGPGGIGKTYLLDYCLQHTPELDKQGYFQIRIDGRKEIHSLEQLFTQEWPASALELRDELQRAQAFPGLTRCAEAVEVIRQRVEARLHKDFADSPALQQKLLTLLSFGLRPQRALEMRPYDLRLLTMGEDELEQALSTLLSLAPFQPESRWFGRKKALRNALRRDLENVLVTHLLSDMSTLLKPSKHRQHGQLLLIFDDYESIEPLVGDFLVEYLLEKLKDAPFETLLLFVGRDNLLATHTAWGQHYRPLLGERFIELKPFQEGEAFLLMRKRGLSQSEVCQRIWDETQGFPFLLDLECEDALSGGRSALGLKLFFERLTRWMTPIQKQWIVPLAFLDEVHLEAVEALLPEHDAQAILDWFKNEPAIRDPHASVWQVLPFVRRRIQQYVKNDSPQRFAALQARGQEVAKHLQNDL